MTTSTRSLRAPAGQMTHVMRSVGTMTRALRVGVVAEGRVVDERLLRDERAITVGSHEGCTFVLGGIDVPSSFTLFEVTKGGVLMRFTEGMHGRIVLSTGPMDLAEARAVATEERKGVYAVGLGEEGRGKVRIGAVTVLFQRVAVPPLQARPQLPASVQRTLQDAIDWPTAFLAAASFLVHFAAVGTLYSDWTDHVVATEADVAGLVQVLPMTPPRVEVEEARPTDASAPTTSTSQAAPSTTRTKAPTGQGPARTAGPASSPRSLDRALDELARLDHDLQALGTLDPSKNASERVLREGNVPTGNLGAIARSDAGSTSGGGLQLGPSAPGVQTTRSLGDLGDGRRASQSDSSGVQQAMAAPRLSVSGTTSSVGARVSGVEATIAAARGRVRACYQAEVNRNPEAKGRVTYTISITPSGQVGSVSATASELPSSVAACVQAALSSLRFDAPEGGASAVVRGSYSFVSQTAPTKKLGRVAGRECIREGWRGDRPAREQVRPCRRT